MHGVVRIAFPTHKPQRDSTTPKAPVSPQQGGMARAEYERSDAHTPALEVPQAYWWIRVCLGTYHPLLSLVATHTCRAACRERGSRPSVQVAKCQACAWWAWPETGVFLARPTTTCLAAGAGCPGATVCMAPHRAPPPWLRGARLEPCRLSAGRGLVLCPPLTLLGFVGAEGATPLAWCRLLLLFAADGICVAAWLVFCPLSRPKREWVPKGGETDSSGTTKSRRSLRPPCIVAPCRYWILLISY